MNGKHLATPMFMELVEGITLAERLERGTPGLSEGVDYIRRLSTRVTL